MARKFLYFRCNHDCVWSLPEHLSCESTGEELAEVVFVPDTEFQTQEVLEDQYICRCFHVVCPTRKSKKVILPSGCRRDMTPNRKMPPKKTSAPRYFSFIRRPLSTRINGMRSLGRQGNGRPDARIFLRGQASAFNQGQAMSGHHDIVKQRSVLFLRRKKKGNRRWTLLIRMF